MADFFTEMLADIDKLTQQTAGKLCNSSLTNFTSNSTSLTIQSRINLGLLQLIIVLPVFVWFIGFPKEIFML